MNNFKLTDYSKGGGCGCNDNAGVSSTSPFPTKYSSIKGGNTDNDDDIVLDDDSDNEDKKDTILSNSGEKKLNQCHNFFIEKNFLDS